MSDLNLSSSPNPAPSTPAAANAELTELKQLCADLRWQTHTLRIALLIVAASLLAFFFLESRRTGQTLTALRPQAAQVNEASKQLDPAINRFLGQLADYAKNRQDFAAILAKYVAVNRAPGVSAPAPAVAPGAKPPTVAPAAAPVPAKK